MDFILDKSDEDLYSSFISDIIVYLFFRPRAIGHGYSISYDYQRNRKRNKNVLKLCDVVHRSDRTCKVYGQDTQVHPG